MVNTKDSEAFVTITNRDIYNEIVATRKEIKEINGQVKLHKKVISIIFGWMAIMTVGFIRFLTSR